MDTTRLTNELKKKAEKVAQTATDPIERLRAACLARGAHGIKGIGRQFRIMDDDRSHTLSPAEFKKGCADFGTGLTDAEVSEIFKRFDTDNDGALSFDEFLIHLRPPLNETRTKLIKAAFTKLDKTKDGQITVADLRGVYNVRQHPKYINGEWSEDDVYKAFLKTFDTPNDPDGVITWEEFLNYYAGVSASIDEDVYFDLMMRQAWKL